MPFGHLVAVVEHGVARHQVTDLADEQQRPAAQGDLVAVGPGVGAVGVHRPGEGLAALGDLLGEAAVHQPQPVAVAEHLVVGVDGGDGVLEVHDRGHRGLDQEVLDPGGVGGADGVVGVDLDLDVQAVVHEQDGLGGVLAAVVADQLCRVGQPHDVVLDRRREAVAVHGVRRDVGVGVGGEREVVVEEGATTGDHLVAADLVVLVARSQVALAGDQVAAVEGVVQGTPAGVDRVGGEAGVQQGHHELRAGDACHLVVDVGGGDRDLVRLVEQVADLAQERRVGLRVGTSGVLVVPGVELLLQVVATGEELAVARREVAHEVAEAVPEGGRIEPRAGKCFLFDEAMKDGGDVETACPNALVHGTPWVRCAHGHRDRPRLGTLGNPAPRVNQRASAPAAW